MKQTDEQREFLKKASERMPVEAVRQLENVLKENFENEGVPYNKETLKACLQMCHLIHPALPPLYGEFVASSILLLIRLIDEQDTGLIASPIKM